MGPACARVISEKAWHVPAQFCGAVLGEEAGKVGGDLVRSLEMTCRLRKGIPVVPSRWLREGKAGLLGDQCGGCHSVVL